MWKLPSWSVTSSSPKRKALLKCPEPYISKKFLSCTRLCEWCCSSSYHSLTAYCVADLVLRTFHPFSHLTQMKTYWNRDHFLNSVLRRRKLKLGEVGWLAHGRSTGFDILALLLPAVWSRESYLASLTPGLLGEQAPWRGSVSVQGAAHHTGSGPRGPSFSVFVAAVQDDEEVRDVRTKSPCPWAPCYSGCCFESSFVEPGDTRSAFWVVLDTIYITPQSHRLTCALSWV